MFRYILEAMELLDTSTVRSSDVRDWLDAGEPTSVQVTRVDGVQGSTEFIKVRVPGAVDGQRSPGPTLGIIGRLGGIGAFPHKLGLVSDADGAVVALACAKKLSQMAHRPERLPGTIIVATHISPMSPIEPHEPTPFMGSPVDVATMNDHEVDPAMDAVLSIDTTKGNWVLNSRGFAITPTVKAGYILRVSESLLNIMRSVTNEPPRVLPITTQDITPYGNGLFHLNSILQPATATPAPVVGVATTATIPVPGCATGANQPFDLERAARFCIEVAKAFTRGECSFHDPDEYARIVRRYGQMTHLQSLGREA